MYQLGYAYENGLDVKADKEKAMKFYKKAAEMGSEDAKLSLELISLDENLKRSKSISNRVIIHSLGSLSTTIANGDLRDIIKEAKSGDKEALFALAVMYENGIAPLKQDDKKAVLFFI